MTAPSHLEYAGSIYQKVQPQAEPIIQQQLPPVHPKKPGTKKAKWTLQRIKAYALNGFAIIGLIMLTLAFFKYSDFARDTLIPATYVDKMAETLKGEGLQTKYTDAADLEKTIRTLTQLKQPTTLKIIQLQANDGVTISGYLIGYKQKGGAK